MKIQQTISISVILGQVVGHLVSNHLLIFYGFGKTRYSFYLCYISKSIETTKQIKLKFTSSDVFTTFRKITKNLNSLKSIVYIILGG